MARGTLHAPKPDGQRRRRNAPAHSEILLHRDDVVRGPEIDDATGSSAWSAPVRRWWETWRRAPQAAVFEETDWQRLALLAPIVEAHFRRPSAAALGEIRMNEERLGATVMDRVRARMRVDDGEPAPPDETPRRESRADARARLQSARDEETPA